MPTLPPQIDNPNLTPAEREGLLVAHEAFVLTGEAKWETDDE